MEKVIVVENLQKTYKPKSRKQTFEVKASSEGWWDIALFTYLGLRQFERRSLD